MKHPKYFDTDAETSKRMANIKLKRGDVEVAIAKELFHAGYRYRFDYKRLPGSPDIAILRYHVAVFIDGEFWHGYNWNERKQKLHRNREYWIEKIEENIARDKRVDEKLKDMGWIPVHFWSKDAKKDISGCVEHISSVIKNINS